MAWVWLGLAGLLEVGWAVGLAYTEGFTKPWATAWTVLGMIASVFFLSLAVRPGSGIPLSTGYAVWTGIGAVGTAILGMMFLGDPVNGVRLIFIAIIVLGIVGLKLSSGH